jgi:very-short-patch-repair endonuclease
VDLYSEAQAFPGRLRGEAAVFSAADLAGHGVTPKAARWRAQHGGIVRAHRGVYLVGDPLDLLDRIAAALAAAPHGAVVGFHTAAALHGFGVVEDQSRIHLVVPTGALFPTHKGIRVHQAALPVGDPALCCEVACTPAARTVIDLARILPRPQALSIMDAALFSQACDQDELRTEVTRHHGLAGIKRVRTIVDLADGRSQCAQETHVRLLIHEAGMTGFQAQYPVLDRYGAARYYIDLADPERLVAAEYDGSSHLGRDSLRNDRTRHNWLDERGWRMRYFTDVDLYRNPRGLLRTLRVALRDR